MNELMIEVYGAIVEALSDIVDTVEELPADPPDEPVATVSKFMDQATGDRGARGQIYATIYIANGIDSLPEAMIRSRNVISALELEDINGFSVDINDSYTKSDLTKRLINGQTVIETNIDVVYNYAWKG